MKVTMYVQKNRSRLHYFLLGLHELLFYQIFHKIESQYLAKKIHNKHCKVRNVRKWEQRYKNIVQMRMFQTMKVQVFT